LKESLDFKSLYVTLGISQHRGEYAVEAMLPKNIQAGLDAARLDSMRKSSHLHVEADGAQHKVLRFWDTGFSLESATAPQLRGHVDLYDGAAHLCQCLIVAVAQEGDEMLFDFKRATRVAKTAALDFERARDAPAGLIGTDAPH
tara:strand:+ start:2702 stop:3133 length:432 start_codon:yes stop_codon:yes gene_type:complete